jgi:hypothetical protein
MNLQQKEAITNFHSAIKELRNVGVIRSDRYLGDLGEFLCADEFGINLATNLREVGHDGLRNTIKVEIKYGGGSKKNIDLGNPNNYEEVYIVLGKESVIRPIVDDADFLVYKLSATQVKLCHLVSKADNTYSCAKKVLSKQKIEKRIFL